MVATESDICSEEAGAKRLLLQQMNRSGSDNVLEPAAGAAWTIKPGFTPRRVEPDDAIGDEIKICPATTVHRMQKVCIAEQRLAVGDKWLREQMSAIVRPANIVA